MCDAVQAETYEIDGIAVSNFVLPLYFAQREKPVTGARNDFLGRAHNNETLKPFGINPGGYIGFFDPQLQRNDTFTRAKDDEAEKRMEVKGRAAQARRSQRYIAAEEKIAVKEAPRAAALATTATKTAATYVSIRDAKREAYAPKPTAPQTVKLEQLEAGDVLLYKGNSLHSRLIEQFDGVPVSHAALYIGDGSVAEAVGAGIRSIGILASADSTDWVAVRRIAKDNFDAAPVVKVANDYIAKGGRYSYEQMILLAFLVISRKVPATPSIGFVIRRILDSAAEVLNKIVSTLEGEQREPMICSELVYRCWAEGAPGAINLDQPTIMARRALDSKKGRGIERGSLLEKISTTSSDAVQPAPRLAVRAVAEVPLEQLARQYLYESQKADEHAEVEVSAEMQTSLARFAAAHYRATSGPNIRAAISGTAMTESLLQTARDFVTPGDLLTSPSLKSIGQIDDRDIHPTDHQAFAAAWKRLAAD